MSISLEDRNGRRGSDPRGVRSLHRREPSEKMSGRREKLITTDKPAVLAEPLLDAIVVEGGQNSGCLANPTSTN